MAATRRGAWRGARAACRIWLAAGALLCAAGPTHGQPAERRVVLPVVVNQVEQGDSEVLLQDADVLVPVALLERAGVAGSGGRRVLRNDTEFVSLASLAPDVSYELDQETLVLSLVIDPALLGRTTFDLAPRAPARLEHTGDTSAFLNYAFNWYESSGVEGFAEVGVSLRGPLLYSSATRSLDGTLARGQTNLTVDDRDHLRRWVLGDSYVSGGALGGSMFFAGVSVARNFELDPYFVRYPTLGLSGAVLTPSTADVYVNGALVGRQHLQPGQFSFENLVMPGGSGAAQVVIRDAFGVERVISEPFYASTALLRAGLSEYAYGLGAERQALPDGGNEYGAPAFLGRHRQGITDDFTAELRLEGKDGLVSGGAGAAFRVLGAEAEIGVAASRADGSGGDAGFAALRYVGRPLSAGGFVRTASQRYRTLGQVSEAPLPRLERSLYAGAELGRRASLTGQYTDQEFHDGERRVRGSLQSSIHLGARTNLLVTLSRSQLDERWATEWFVSLSSFLGGTTTASLSYQRAADRGAVMADIQKSRPLGVGYGYRANAVAADGDVNGSALAEYQGPFGRYEAAILRSAGEEFLSAGVSGGVVALGGVVLPSRPIRDAFALIRVPELAGLDGSWSNQPVGKTNRRGDLVVPDLLSYQANRLGIDDQDVPLDWEVLASERVVAPPYRGGAVVEFPVRRHSAVTGELTVVGPEREVTPAFGTLTVTVGRDEFRSPIGGRGEFYLENVPVGRHPAAVDFAGGRCDFVLEVPVKSDAVVNLGSLRCAAERDER